MGNKYSFTQPTLPEGTIAVIKHDKFTTDEEIPNDILKTGSVVKVMHSTNMMQSRPNARPITISRVLFKDGTTEVHLNNNLGRKQ